MAFGTSIFVIGNEPFTVFIWRTSMHRGCSCDGDRFSEELTGKEAGEKFQVEEREYLER
jgi:hypothetical protein